MLHSIQNQFCSSLSISSKFGKSFKQEDTFYADLIGSAYLKDPYPNDTTSTQPDDTPRTPRAMSRFRTTPWEVETISSRAIVSQDQRLSDQGKLSKLRESAIDPITNKLDVIPFDDSSEQILNNYNLQMSVREFTRHLQQYDMGDVFTILQLSDSTSTTPLPETLNLLEQWEMMDVHILDRRIKFMLSFGQ